MAFDAFLSLALLAIATLFTPGPNNALLATSGVNFGFRRTLPHLFGVSLGFGVMLFIVGLFLGELFKQSALLQAILGWVSVGLLLFVAYQIATTGGLSSAKGEPRPFRFVEAAAFQWVNPKAWAMAIAVTAQFVKDAESAIMIAAFISVVFSILGTASAATWVGLGQVLRRFLQNPLRLRIFNLTMAGLIVSNVVIIFLE